MSVDLSKTSTAYDNDPEHSPLCDWPYRRCVHFCEHVQGWESAKFDSPLAERLWALSLDLGQDAELGEAEGFGWYALFAGEHAILAANSQGFVWVSLYADADAARTAWAEVERNERLYAAEATVDAIGDPRCDGLFLIIDTAKHIGGVATREELEEHIYGCDQCRTEYVWVLDL